MDFRVEHPIALPSPPSSVLPGPNGTAYVLSSANGTMHTVSASRRVIGSLVLGPGIVQLREGNGSNSLFAISSAPPQLLRIEQKSNRITHRHHLKATPRFMDVVMAGEGRDLVATSSGKAGVVELFDTQAGSLRRTQLDGEIGDLRFRADGQLLLVSNLSGRSLFALSVPDLELIAELPLAMQPQSLCLSRDDGQLFITGDGMDGVAIVFPYNRVLQVDQTVLAGRDPGVMACSDNPALLFVGSASGSDVCVMSIDSYKVIGIVDVAQHPGFITVTPDNQYALVLNRESGDVAFIRIPAIRTNPAIVISKSGASLFTMLSVGREPVHAAVIRGQN